MGVQISLQDFAFTSMDITDFYLIIKLVHSVPKGYRLVWCFFQILFTDPSDSFYWALFKLQECVKFWYTVYVKSHDSVLRQ